MREEEEMGSSQSSGAVPSSPQEATRESPTEAAIAGGLALLNALEVKECRAFLGLFAGARREWTVFDDGRTPFIGKAECEWVDDWRDFYAVRLVDAGLVSFEELDSGPALGMVRKEDGTMHTWTKIECHPTALGWAVRDAWWDFRTEAARNASPQPARQPNGTTQNPPSPPPQAP